MVSTAGGVPYDAKLISLEEKYMLDKRGEDGYNNNRRALLQGS